MVSRRRHPRFKVARANMEFRKVIQSDIKAFQEVAKTAGLEPK